MYSTSAADAWTDVPTGYCATDRFAVVFGTRRGTAREREREVPVLLLADLREPERWWWDAENNPRAGGSYMDLRRWLDQSSETGHGWLEAWLEGVPGQSTERTWTVETWARPGSKRRQRRLGQRELDWLEMQWLATLWWRVDRGTGHPVLRGGLFSPQPCRGGDYSNWS
jgi:hypothetical protein